MDRIPDGTEPLTAAERELLRCAEEGEIWAPRLMPGENVDPDPAKADTWPEARRLRAGIVRALLTGEKWNGLGPWSVHSMGVRVDGTSGSGVEVVAALIDGDLDLTNCELRSALALWGCVIRGAVKLDNSRTKNFTLAGSIVKRVSAARVTVDGYFTLSQGFKTEETVRLNDARISGVLNLSGGKFLCPESVAISAHRITVDSNVFMDDDFHAIGGVAFTRAKIGGILRCSRATFENPTKVAFDAESLNTATDVFFDGATVKGKLNFAGARIDGSIVFSGAQLHNLGNVALEGDSMRVSTIFMDGGFKAEGGVYLVRAQIRGALLCSGSRFYNPGSTALNCARATCGDNVDLDDEFAAVGRVRLADAKLAGDLRCDGGSFENPGGVALDLNSITITSALFLRNMKSLDGHVDLRDATVRAFYEDGSALPSTSGKAGAYLNLDGFSYERLIASPSTFRALRDWLMRQPPKDLKGDFKRQPWNQVIRAVSEAGQMELARRLAVARERVASRRRPAARLSGWLFGYGYRPMLPILWAALLLVPAWFAFDMAADLGYFTPRDSTVQTAARYWGDNGCALPAGYPRLNTFVFTIDSFLPIIELGQKASWTTAAAPKSCAGAAVKPMLADAIPPPVDRAVRPILSSLFARGLLDSLRWFLSVLGWTVWVVLPIAFRQSQNLVR